MKHLFFITILLMGSLLILEKILDPPVEKPKKEYYYEHKNMDKPWDNPDNLKQIKRKYKL